MHDTVVGVRWSDSAGNIVLPGGFGASMEYYNKFTGDIIMKIAADKIYFYVPTTVV